MHKLNPDGALLANCMAISAVLQIAAISSGDVSKNGVKSLAQFKPHEAAYGRAKEISGLIDMLNNSLWQPEMAGFHPMAVLRSFRICWFVCKFFSNAWID